MRQVVSGIWAIAALAGVSIAGQVLAQGPAPSAAPAPAAIRAPNLKDVVVARIDDLGTPFDLKMNVYMPAKGAGSAPLVIYYHGKGGSYAAGPNDPIVRRLIALTDRGIVVATADYRQSGRLMGMVQDAKAYVRHFRANAARYGIDPNRIAVWGVSRGAGLTSIMATTGDVAALEGSVGGNAGVSSKVQAAVIEYPISDIFLNSDKKIEELLPQYFGSTPAESTAAIAAYKAKDKASSAWKYVEAAEQLNPIDYVTKDSPPVLITIGGRDESNPFVNSAKLFDKYVQAGAVANFYAYSLGTHGKVGADVEAPSVEWLAGQLKGPAVVSAR